MRWRVCLFAFTLVLTFFKAFCANPRLNVIAQTINKASNDLTHFFIVLLAVFFVFAAIGHIIFGHRMIHFSSPMKTVDSMWYLTLGFLFDEISDDMHKAAG